MKRVGTVIVVIVIMAMAVKLTHGATHYVHGETAL